MHSDSTATRGVNARAGEKHHEQHRKGAHRRVPRARVVEGRNRSRDRASARAIDTDSARIDLLTARELEQLEQPEPFTVDVAVNLLSREELHDAWRVAELELERTHEAQRVALERGRAGSVDDVMQAARETVDALEQLANRLFPGAVKEWRLRRAGERRGLRSVLRRFEQLELFPKGGA